MAEAAADGRQVASGRSQSGLAMRADALDDIVGRRHRKARRHRHLGNLDGVQAVGALTALAEEVDVQVVVVLVAMAMAQLIAQRAAPVLDGMHHVVLAEERQRAEHARLVDRGDAALQLAERHRPSGLAQRPSHHDAVGRRLHPVLLQQLQAIVLFHRRKGSHFFPYGDTF